MICEELTLHDVDGQSAADRLFVFDAVECESCCRNRLHRANGIPLDAGDLHESADRIAGESEMVFHADLRGILHLLRSTAEDLRPLASSYAVKTMPVG